jgi:hypothetical protein
MKKALLLLLVFTAVSCQKTVVFKDVKKDFSDNQWVATDVKKFEFKLKKDVEAGDIKTIVLACL